MKILMANCLLFNVSHAVHVYIIKHHFSFECDIYHILMMIFINFINKVTLFIVLVLDLKDARIKICFIYKNIKSR